MTRRSSHRRGIHLRERPWRQRLITFDDLPDASVDVSGLTVTCSLGAARLVATAAHPDEVHRVVEEQKRVLLNAVFLPDDYEVHTIHSDSGGQVRVRHIPSGVQAMGPLSQRRAIMRAVVAKVIQQK